MPDVILIHSPLVGPLSLKATADALLRLGVRAHLPTPATKDGAFPPWRDWPGLLLEDLGETRDAIVVGHSAGGLLAASVAALTGARAVVCLDAMMPPANGPTPPVEPSFRQFIGSLPVADGRLPPWNRWWGGDVLAAAPLDPDFKAAFVAALPELRLDWFDDAFDMPDWSRSARHFIRTSKVFDEEADRAEGLGWAVTRIDGTHLHPTLAPEETAAALLAI